MAVYLDNSATSFPKPESVYRAMDHFARHIGASAGRGNYAEAAETGEIILECRRRLARLFHAPDPDRFVFGLNCSDALNLALKGVLAPGDHVVTTWMEHNSVLRPLREMEDRGMVTVTRVRCDGEGFVDPDDLRKALQPATRLIAVVHSSNVTGTLQPVREIARMARESGVLCLVDAAQSVGHVPIDLGADGFDLIAFPGHKGLLGPLGTGVLHVRPGLDLALVREGGTGSRSELDRQPDFWPDRHEAGSHNALGIVGLSEGLAYLLERGLEDVRGHDEAIMERFLVAAAELDGVTVFGPSDPHRRTPVFSVRVDGWDPVELAATLDREYAIKSRAGLHCAPLAHQTIGSWPEGATRFSFGHFNQPEDADFLARALSDLAQRRAIATRH